MSKEATVDDQLREMASDVTKKIASECLEGPVSAWLGEGNTEFVILEALREALKKFGHPAQTRVSKSLAWKHSTRPPRVVCLCGSTRFLDQFFRSGWAETLAGNIVLSIGVVVDHPGDAEGGHVGEALGVKDALDELHFRKIDLADEILVLNLDGYIGKSTQREMAYAIATNKGMRFLEPENGELVMGQRSHEMGQQVASFVNGKVPDA